MKRRGTAHGRVVLTLSPDGDNGVTIGEDIEVKYSPLKNGRVKLVITAPRSERISRVRVPDEGDE